MGGVVGQQLIDPQKGNTSLQANGKEPASRHRGKVRTEVTRLRIDGAKEQEGITRARTEKQKSGGSARACSLS